MFELLKFGGSAEAGIALETRQRTPIPNSQAPNVSSASLRKFQRLLQDHRDWRLRKPACGLYNCYGHIWASRRTAIYDQPAVELILREDGYRRLRPQESPINGDVLLYYVDAQYNSMLHVGSVCELRRLALNNVEMGAPVPWILSKWDDSSGEVLHHVNDVPWQDGEFTIAFWTDRV